MVSERVGQNLSLPASNLPDDTHRIVNQDGSQSVWLKCEAHNGRRANDQASPCPIYRNDPSRRHGEFARLRLLVNLTTLRNASHIQSRLIRVGQLLFFASVNLTYP